MPVPVLLDCDTGIDDAIALAYLAATPEARLVGVVSTGGNVPAAQVARNNLALTDLLGLEVPVALGASTPLVEPPRFAEDTHGPTGLGYATLPASDRALDPRRGAQLWVDAARAHPGELVGIVIGPHTNLALALELEPELPSLLRRLHVMGGALNHRGNTAPTSEWNIAADPEAAQRVFAAFGAARQHPVLGPLDVTEDVVFTAQTLQRIGAASTHPVIGVLLDALRWYVEFHAADGFGPIAHVHDPFVVAHAVTGRFARTAPVALDVELDGTLTRGQTVADWLGRWDRAPNVDVMVQADAAGFIDHLVETLTALPTAPTPAPSGQ